ncbi:MAG: phage major capsid protein [Verrucomicrobiae bacterium]|nr:phage major capsid protein [Verrucomicrobiae bacterium]
MSDELKNTIEAIGKAFEEFKAENDKRIQELATKKDDPVLAEKIEKINAELTDLKNLKTDLENLEKTVARSEFPGGGSSNDGIKGEHRKAFESWFRKGGDDRLEAVKKLQVEAGLSTLSDPDGGYIVAPPEFDQAIDRVAETVSVMRQLATVRTIGVNEYKKIVNQGGSSSGWVAEKETRSETDTPTLKQITINMKEVYAEPGATQLALDDTMMDLASWLADEVSIEFAEQEGEAFITGDGVAKPRGIAGYDFVANSSYSWGNVGYVAGGHATLLNNADKLIALQHALKSVYRTGATFLMNDTTCEKVRTLKDGEGNYIWRPGLLTGTPDTLLGKPVAYDDNVADIGAGAYPIFFGNFKRAYLILDRMGIRVLRDPYTSKGNVLFYTTKRVGGGLIMFEAIKALKIATS